MMFANSRTFTLLHRAYKELEQKYCLRFHFSSAELCTNNSHVAIEKCTNTIQIYFVNGTFGQFCIPLVSFFLVILQAFGDITSLNV